MFCGSGSVDEDVVSNLICLSSFWLTSSFVPVSLPVSPVIAIPSQYVVIFTILVYALLAPIFFEMDNNAFGGETYFVVDDKNKESDKTMISNIQQVVEIKECKSPCPSSAEMCIEICA